MLNVVVAVFAPRTFSSRVVLSFLFRCQRSVVCLVREAGINYGH